ncbi:hypothetical protein L218DRAFT_951666, partial [Marasmius fiardii PR-910]
MAAVLFKSQRKCMNLMVMVTIQRPRLPEGLEEQDDVEEQVVLDTILQQLDAASSPNDDNDEQLDVVVSIVQFRLSEELEEPDVERQIINAIQQAATSPDDHNDELLNVVIFVEQLRLLEAQDGVERQIIGSIQALGPTSSPNDDDDMQLDIVVDVEKLRLPEEPGVPNDRDNEQLNTLLKSGTVQLT